MSAPKLTTSLIDRRQPSLQDLNLLLTELDLLISWLAKRRCEGSDLLAEDVGDQIKDRIRIEDLGEGLTITYSRKRPKPSKTDATQQAPSGDPATKGVPPLDLLREARMPRSAESERIMAKDSARVMHAMLRAYVQYAAMEGLRRDSRRGLIRDQLAHEPPRSYEDPPQAADDAEMRRQVSSAVSRLPGRMAEVIRLTMEGLPQEQIGATMKLTRSALYRLRVAALRELRESLAAV